MATYFRSGQSACKPCQEIPCACCGEMRQQALYTYQGRGNYFNLFQNVRCETCRAKGDEVKSGAFRQQSAKMHTCDTCHRTLMKSRFRVKKRRMKDTCTTCERIVCASCKNSKPNEDFDDGTVSHHWKHQRTAVCNTCKARGSSNRDTRMYLCTGNCGEMYGHRRFDALQLSNFNSHGRKILVCEECIKKDKEKAKSIEKALKKRGAWKCTCHNPIHAEKCQLYDRRRWPGGNVGVSKEDYEFWKNHGKQ